MGTNYYLKYDYCSHCGRYREIHIGKDSVDWKFIFQTHPDLGINGFNSLRDFIKDDMNSIIFDDYGKEYSWEEFWKIVDESMRTNGFDLVKNSPVINGPIKCYYDSHGYTFREGDFC